MITRNISRQIAVIAPCAMLVFGTLLANGADSGIIKFQESSASSSDSLNGLIGHWRKTTIGYTGPISIEWEDAGMDRLHGAPEALAALKKFDFPASQSSFDAAFSTQD